MEDKFKPLMNDNDVIEIINKFETENARVFLNQPMFKVKDIIIAIKCRLLQISTDQLDKKNGESIEHRKRWLSEGIHCELLQLGSYQWKKGKIRVNVTVEFAPDDETESPLDDVRQGNKTDEA